jgi:phenylacetate-CoA ligase
MTPNKKTLDLFHKAAKEVPAYKAFLADHKIDSASVTAANFATVPITSKKNYLQKFTRENLIWKEDQDGPLWFCSTSGSTGEPYYFPRRDELAWRGSWFCEDFLKYSTYGMGKTLVIMGFGMGVWIGGVITLRSFEIAAERLKAPVSFLPAGYNKTEIFKALKKLSPEFDQTILVGYPPFIKDVVDEAEEQGIDLSELHVRLMFAAEAFTETFRNYVSQKAGITNTLLDTLNIYGSADVGAMGHETPLSILVRKLALEDPLLYRDVFGQIEKTPTLAQYNPNFVEFEEIDGELFLTSDGAMPFMRYAIGDYGGIFTYNHITELFKKHSINLDDEIQKASITQHFNKNPFVFVYERTDLSATLQGIIIYPEFIKEALLATGMPELFTSKFTISTKHDVHHNQFLQINIELQNDIEANDELEATACQAITSSLIERSSEFAEVSKSHTGNELIQIIFWPKDHPRYFAPGTKQKWVEK